LRHRDIAEDALEIFGHSSGVERSGLLGIDLAEGTVGVHQGNDSIHAAGEYLPDFLNEEE
jgi:hypothetical protein